jgi:1-acyl-sn-glycerol-3-phosphate acyltransferase
MSRPVTRTPVVARCVRIARLVAHLFRGLYTCARVFGRGDIKREGAETRRWARELLAIIGVRVRCVGEPAHWPARAMVVSNHISWLDIPVLLSVHPVIFVAKSEVRGWPLVGKLVADVGTVFIERGTRRGAHRTNNEIGAALGAGRVIAFCPEGTTGPGDHLMKFHAALFQPAIEAKAVLQPLGLRYLDQHGRFTQVPAYIGAMNLFQSAWRIASEPHMTVEVRFAPSLSTVDAERRALSANAHAAISEVLGFAPVPHKAPARAPDLPVAAQ